MLLVSSVHTAMCLEIFHNKLLGRKENNGLKTALIWMVQDLLSVFVSIKDCESTGLSITLWSCQLA